MEAKLIRDARAVLAMETLQKYCDDIGCEKCIFHLKGHCLFRKDEAPIDWEMPEDYRI